MLFRFADNLAPPALLTSEQPPSGAKSSPTSPVLVGLTRVFAVLLVVYFVTGWLPRYLKEVASHTQADTPRISAHDSGQAPQGSLPSPSSNSADQKGMDELVRKISNKSGISEDNIRRMTATQQRELADRWLAEYTDKPVSQVQSMSVSDKLESAMEGVARKYGISVSDATRMYELLERIDRGQTPTLDEQQFLRRIRSKIGG